MRTLGTSSVKTIILSVLIIATAAVPTVNQAQPSEPILECRHQAIDETGFVECLALLLEQSESALDAIEENWRTELVVEQSAVNEKSSESRVEKDDMSAAVAAVVEKLPAQNDGVQGSLIAIVGDQTAGADTHADALVINVDDEATSQASLADRRQQQQNLEMLARRFSAIPDLYRKYRDQRCEWEANLPASGQSSSFYQACLIALNRQRVVQLRRLLVEKRASDVAGESFRGYYVRTASGGVFQSCDRRQDWWVTGSDATLQLLTRRYDDITSESLEMVYIEVRGRTAGPVSAGPGADFAASVELSAVNLMRPIFDQDCGSVKQSDGELDDENLLESVDEDDELAVEAEAQAPVRPKAVTVDDLGDAGFLYGYFSNWRSACAIDQLAVCSAQTNADYSTEDLWVVSVDRSSDGDWRIQLIPTTENKSMGRLLQLSVDDSNISTLKIADTTTQANRGIVIASGARARALLGPMRNGQSLGFDWIKPDQTGAKLSFSLVGITRALKYFDQAEK